MPSTFSGRHQHVQVDADHYTSSSASSSPPPPPNSTFSSSSSNTFGPASHLLLSMNHEDENPAQNQGHGRGTIQPHVQSHHGLLSNGKRSSLKSSPGGRTVNGRHSGGSSSSNSGVHLDQGLKSHGSGGGIGSNGSIPLDTLNGLHDQSHSNMDDPTEPRPLPRHHHHSKQVNGSIEIHDHLHHPETATEHQAHQAHLPRRSERLRYSNGHNTNHGNSHHVSSPTYQHHSERSSYPSRRLSTSLHSSNTSPSSPTASSSASSPSISTGDSTSASTPTSPSQYALPYSHHHHQQHHHKEGESIAGHSETVSAGSPELFFSTTSMNGSVGGGEGGRSRTRSKSHPELPDVPLLQSCRSASVGCSAPMATIFLISLLLLGCIFHSNFYRQVDKDNCEFTYMQPKYYKLLGFDRARTQFAGKYGLLLFRDRYDYEVPVPPRLLKEYANNVYTIDKEARVRPLGIPALFIPGNAGSAKQVRSIAKEASRYYYETYLPERLRIGSTMSRPIDFFTVDFNEEFSALHGHSLLEQAQFLNDAIAYILSLYEDNNSRSLDSTLPKPTSVLILGHSMGGVVARSLFTMSNYKPGSVNTIVTAATPHMVPPVTLDFEISNIYNTIENFWTRGFLEGSDGSAASLANVSLVSIAGGNLDIVVNGDSGNIHNLVPQKNGFSVFTSSFPHAWVGADHVSILWCNQIATVIGKTLIDIVDASYAEQVKPLEERMKIFRNRFLTGVEDHIEKATYLPDTEIIDLSMVDHTIVDSRHPLVYPPKSSATHDVESTNPHFYVIPIPQTLDVDTFNLVTDYPLDIGTRLEVLRCKGQSFNDYSSTGSAPSTLTCKHGAFAAVPIPASPAQLASALGTRSNRAQEFRFISQKLDVINKDTDYIVLQDHGRKLAETGFVIAEFGAEKNSTLVTPTTTLGLLSNGFRLHAFPERPSLVSTLRFPNIDNSLLTYTLTVERQGCRTPQKFAPMMRRSSWLMYEDRYTSNIADRGSVDINFHGDVPYYERIQLPGKKGIELRFWMDPTCPVQLSLSMQVDRYGSMGKVMIRYRMVVLVFTYLVVVLTLRAQFRAWNRGEPFKPFGNMISQLITSTFWKFSLLLAAIAFLQSLQSRALVSLDAQGAVMMSSNAGSGVRNSNAEDEVRYGPGGRAAPYSFPGSREGLGQDAYERMVRARIARSESWFSSFRFSDALLGTNDTFFWFLAPVFFQISIGIVILIWLTLSGLVRSVAALLTFVSKRGGRYVIGQAIGNMLSKRSRGVRRRVITTIVLFIMVATFVPYQFAFVVAVLVHIVSCVRSLLTAQSASATSRAQASWDRYHYLMSIFVMFFLLLPCTLPVLMVWIRNLSVQWYEPFSSDHRLDYIAPFIFFVEAITDGAMIPRTPEKGYAAITIGILNYIIFFLILFGVRYSWQIFFMSRLWIVWLLILQLKDTEMVMGIAKTIEHLYGQAFAGPGKKQK